jgi:enterochelin esterase family protein
MAARERERPWRQYASGGHANWVIANNCMADALKAKGYPYQFVFSEAVGHIDRNVERQTMPEAFEWVWKEYKPAGR